MKLKKQFLCTHFITENRKLKQASLTQALNKHLANHTYSSLSE
jgi:hypothetical protein